MKLKSKRIFPVTLQRFSRVWRYKGINSIIFCCWILSIVIVIIYSLGFAIFTLLERNKTPDVKPKEQIEQKLNVAPPDFWDDDDFWQEKLELNN